MPLKTGALIVAAGMSSRMGGFKPMLKIGSITLAQRIIITLRQAGAGPIVVVTGHNADIFEKHLSNMGIVFLRNEYYKETQMFDSVKIGLEYIGGQCDRVLFSPVDVPLFTQKTVNLLLNCGSPLATPVFEDKEGHPLLIATALIPEILNYRGSGGLAGAIKNCGQERMLVPVKDNGTIFDVDTPEDYQELLQRYNSLI